MLEIYQIVLIKNNQTIKAENVNIKTKLTHDKYLSRYRKKHELPDDVTIHITYKDKSHAKEN